MSSPVTDKVVLITGPARGIGAETARRLAARGARLSLVGLEADRLAQLAADLGSEHRWFECDVTDQAALGRAVDGTVRAFGGLDVVVANAGVLNHGTVAVTPVEALVRTLDVNLSGVVRTVSATLPQVTARRGYYLLISSAAAIATIPSLSTYAAAKVGVEFFGNALRLELAHKGVAVGVVHPIWVDTDLVRDPQRELKSFNAILRALPWPFGSVIPVDVCVTALVRAIERRSRKVYVPRALAPIAAVRQVLASPLAEWVIRRQARRLVPEYERDVQTLGRAFGATSIGLGKDVRPSG